MSSQDELESQEDVEVHKRDSERIIRCQFKKDDNDFRYPPVANVDADVGVDLGQCGEVGTDESVDLGKNGEIKDVALGESDNEVL